MTLEERCPVIVPLQVQNGKCAILDLEAHVAPKKNPINLISVPAIHKGAGYKYQVYKLNCTCTLYAVCIHVKHKTQNSLLFYIPAIPAGLLECPGKNKLELEVPSPLSLSLS